MDHARPDGVPSVSESWSEAEAWIFPLTDVAATGFVVTESFSELGLGMDLAFVSFLFRR
jgi:hypothetical protein